MVEFDESLNKFAKKQKMDVVVKFCNKIKVESETRYLSSVFLSNAKAPDLQDGLIKSVGEDNLDKIAQVSMDSPAVNFCMLNSLKLELSKYHPQNAVILDIGSCGLHTVHASFKAGITILKWGVVEFLKFLGFLFDNSPSRRGD